MTTPRKYHRLSPCPFCHARIRVTRIPAPYGWRWRYECPSCHVRFYTLHTTSRIPTDKALRTGIRVWNLAVNGHKGFSWYLDCIREQL